MFLSTKETLVHHSISTEKRELCEREREKKMFQAHPRLPEVIVHPTFVYRFPHSLNFSFATQTLSIIFSNLQYFAFLFLVLIL